jgi:hypothetical protein
MNKSHGELGAWHKGPESRPMVAQHEETIELKQPHEEVPHGELGAL